MENTEYKNDVVLESAARIIRLEQSNAAFFMKKGFLSIMINTPYDVSLAGTKPHFLSSNLYYSFHANYAIISEKSY